MVRKTRLEISDDSAIIALIDTGVMDIVMHVHRLHDAPLRFNASVQLIPARQRLADHLRENCITAEVMRRI